MGKDLFILDLPSEHEGERRRFRIVGGSSTRQQIARELSAFWNAPVPESLVGRVERRRAAECEERERLRRLREARWRAVASGERPAATMEEAFELTPGMGGGKSGGQRSMARASWSPGTTARKEREARSHAARGASGGRRDPYAALEAAIERAGAA